MRCGGIAPSPHMPCSVGRVPRALPARRTAVSAAPVSALLVPRLAGRSVIVAPLETLLDAAQPSPSTTLLAPPADRRSSAAATAIPPQPSQAWQQADLPSQSVSSRRLVCHRRCSTACDAPGRAVWAPQRTPLIGAALASAPVPIAVAACSCCRPRPSPSRCQTTTACSDRTPSQVQQLSCC